MKKYKESLILTPEPILLSQCLQVKMDLKGLMEYAKNSGRKVADLTEEEKGIFLR